MAKSPTLKVIEQSKIWPTQTAAPQISLPLTFFDIPWLFFSPSQPLIFFEYPYPVSQFLSTTLPDLKHSLSLTLQHLFPFAGTLKLPQGSIKPHIVYAQGDYVLLTVAESNDDFNHLSGNHQRYVNEFYSLVPELANSGRKQVTIPLLAVQATVFPGVGLCLGFAYQHVVADGRTFNNFLKTWASFCRDPSCCLIASLVPSYDRLAIKDTNGLEKIFLNEWYKRRSSQAMIICNEMADVDLLNTVRATFLVSPNDMEKIKQWIISRCKNKNWSEPTNMSPSNLTCAFVWVCYVKAQAKANERDKSFVEDPSYFGFNAGTLTRLDYPIPATYFGNCIAFAGCVATKDELLGEDGIIVAASVIGNKVKELDKDILGGAEKWISDFEAFFGSELHVMVAGSPKLDFYETDFGWGRPKKIEEISIDKMRAISFTESRHEKGGIEVGLALPKAKMDAFTLFFIEGLNVLQ